MQTANVLVAIGGDRGNTVPRYFVSAAEIAVLRAIHGEDSVFDIEPMDDIKVKNRDELLRLKQVYGGPNTARIVEGLFPGAAARVFEDLDELDIDEEFYKPETRAQPKKPAKSSESPKEAAKSKKLQASVERAKTAGVAREQNKEAVDDGVRDMPDSGVLS